MPLNTITLVQAYEDLFQPLSMDAAANLRVLAGMLSGDSAMADIRRQAYALATVHRECGPDFKPRAEEGPAAYFARYEPSTETGRILGNSAPGDGYLFRGRGYVQLTGRRNYFRFGQLLKLDLVNAPDTALKTDIAYRILSDGMTKGLFTGLGFWRFIHDGECDYVQARRIINGLDHAEEIAAAAIKFEQALKEASE